MARTVGETLYIRAGIRLSDASWNAIQARQLHILFVKDKETARA